ncbi:S8 family peptidase [Parapedobacter sp. ISTM3]|uniref:S8 family serine peptidase n=1 Tax=Parapedobacter sp. ISTM3 TaxID=2800130 RepID=UPI001902D3AD|nr:S8 family serine peptidase [Parapedobacter sp. ISTM3]MBK1440153.1 S8 family peptidase [Parapedobacter sp. ISTM3]
MKKCILIAITAFGIYFSCYSQMVTNFQGRQYEQKDDKWHDEYGNIVNNKIITVKLKDGLQQTISAEIGRKVRENSLGYIDVELSKDIEFFSQLRTISEDPNIESIDINTFGVYNAFQVTPNDPQLTNQWYLNRIQARNVWNYTMGSSSCIVVGVLDSGVDWEHEDLGVGHDTYQNIWLNPGEDIWSNQNNPNTGNGIDDDTDGLIDNWKGWNYSFNSNDVRTNNGHGTQVSGIISAKANNNRGIAGIAGGNNDDGVKILGLCIGIAAPDGSVMDDAILHAVDKGVRIIQISATVGETSAINAAIEHAINNGVVVVCAAGNGFGAPVSYPARNSNVISVGATNQNDQRATFSNFGSNLVIAAPGEGIRTTTLNNQYDDLDGTSFAAPMVSATIALMLSINPGLTPAQIRNIITSTADKVGGYIYVGGRCDELGFGRLNTHAAVQAALPSITGPSTLCTSETYTVTNLPAGATVTWSASPAGAVTLSGSGNSRTVTRSGSYSGWVTLSATLGTSCGNTVLTRDIYVGFPYIECIAYSNAIEEGDFTCQHDGGVSYLCTTHGNNRILIKTDAPHTQYEIQIRSYPSLAVVSTQTTTSKLTTLSYVPSVPGWYNIRVRAIGSISCGPGPWQEDDIEFMDCSGMDGGTTVWKVFPNPANETLTVALGSKAGGSGLPDKSALPAFRVTLYDSGGRQLRQGESKEGRVAFDTRQLAAGTYFVHIHHNGEVEKRQVVIRH